MVVCEVGLQCVVMVGVVVWCRRVVCGVWRHCLPVACGVVGGDDVEFVVCVVGCAETT